MLAAWAVLLPFVAQDGASIREQVRRLLHDDIEVRTKAEEELRALPVASLDAILVEAERHPQAEVREVVDRLRIRRAWIPLLPGSVAEARANVVRLENLRHPDRPGLVKRIHADLKTRPPEEVSRILLGLLEAPAAEGAVHFSLEALREWPPSDPGPLLPYFRDPKTAAAVAGVLALMDAERVVPPAVELFVEAGPAAPAAAIVLARHSAAEHADRIARTMRLFDALFSPGIEILRRMGPDAEPALVALAEEGVAPHRMARVAETLAAVATERSLPALRKAVAGLPPDSADVLLRTAKDPEWARDHLARLRASGDSRLGLAPLPFAAIGGGGLRPVVVGWLSQPGLKISVQKNVLLPLLGACGTPEDLPLALERLEDPRLAEAAIEALDMLGDPRAARPVMQAVMRIGPARGGRLVLGLAPDDLEEELLEVLDDPRGYILIARAALSLAERRLTPRLRARLVSMLHESSARTMGLRTEAVRILVGAPDPVDARDVETLKASPEPFAQAVGLALACRLGQAGAEAELCRLLAGPKTSYEGTRTSLVDLVAPHPDAVRAAWKESPRWQAGLLYLASRGTPEAVEALRTSPVRNPLDAERVQGALASGGDAKALDALLDRALKGFLPPAQERTLLAALDPERTRRVLAALPAPGPLRLAALKELPEAAPALLEWAGKTAHPDRLLAGPCFRALLKLRRDDAVRLLRPRLGSALAEVRATAADALGEAGDRPSIPALVRLLDDAAPVHEGEGGAPVRRVWHAALEALPRITGAAAEGRTISDRRAFWKRWHAAARDNPR